MKFADCASLLYDCRKEGTDELGTVKVCTWSIAPGICEMSRDNLSLSYIRSFKFSLLILPRLVPKSVVALGVSCDRDCHYQLTYLELVWF